MFKIKNSIYLCFLNCNSHHQNIMYHFLNWNSGKKHLKQMKHLQGLLYFEVLNFWSETLHCVRRFGDIHLIKEIVCGEHI